LLSLQVVRLLLLQNPVLVMVAVLLQAEMDCIGRLLISLAIFTNKLQKIYCN
jgi:hypothetical protein